MSAGLALLALGFIVLAFEVEDVARYMPFIVGVPTFLLASLATITDIADRGAREVADGEERDVGPHALSKRAMWGWIALLFGMFWFLGMVPTILLYISGYMHIVGRERALTAAAVAGGTTLVVYLIFVKLLGAGVYRGYLVGELLPAVTGG